MSQEPVEIIRAVVEAYQTREALARLVSGVVDPRFVELFDPEIEWDISGIGEWMPSDLSEVYWGYEGMRTYWRRWLEAWRDVQSEILDVRGAGDDVVVLMHNSRFWGRHSGILTELPPYGMVYTFREGKVVRMRAYPDHESALKAVGLKG